MSSFTPLLSVCILFTTDALVSFDLWSYPVLLPHTHVPSCLFVQVNYTPLEVARIAQLVANKKFSLTFEPGLLEALADHIELAHGRINRAGTTDIAQQNGGLAVNLTEVAFRRLAKRVVEDGIPIGDPTTSMLVPSDFLIGQELVPLEEEGQPAIEEPATTWYPEGVTDIDGLLDYLQIPQYKEVFSDEEVELFSLSKSDKYSFVDCPVVPAC